MPKTTPTEDKQVAVFQKEVNPLIAAAEKLEIKTADDMKVATATLSEMNKVLDRVEDEKNKILKPLKEAAAAEKARWKPIEDTFKPLIERVRKLMGEYQTAKKRFEDEEAARIEARIGKGKGKLKAETAINKIANIEKVEDKVSTDSGSVGFRTDKILKITDINIVPPPYWVIDEKLLLADLKAGKTIPGAEIEEIQVPINRRK